MQGQGDTQSPAEFIYPTMSGLSEQGRRRGLGTFLTLQGRPRQRGQVPRRRWGGRGGGPFQKAPESLGGAMQPQGVLMAFPASDARKLSAVGLGEGPLSSTFSLYPPANPQSEGHSRCTDTPLPRTVGKVTVLLVCRADTHKHSVHADGFTGIVLCHSHHNPARWGIFQTGTGRQRGSGTSR